MDMEVQKPTLLQQGMKFGLILGFTQVVVYLLLYVIDKNLLVSFGVGAMIMVLSIILMVLPVRNYKSITGVITFKEAFVICLITIAGALLITTVFNYILYNIIDTTLAEFIKENVIGKTASMMEKFGAPQEEIEKQITKLQAEDYSQSPGRLGIQYMSGVLFGAIPALIIAAILRTKNKPVDDIQ